MGDKTPRVTRINCKLKDFPAGSKFGIFIGCWLVNKFDGDSEKIRSSLKNSWFTGLLRNDLKKFMKKEDTNITAIEDHFKLSVGIYSGFRIRESKLYHGKITKYPKRFMNSVWFDYILETKRNNAKDVEYQLLTNFDCRKIISQKKTRKTGKNSTQKDLKISDFSDLMFLLTGEKRDFGPLFMGNIASQEAKSKINIILLESDPKESSGKKFVRKKPFLSHPKTVNLLIAPGVSQKLLEPIQNFKLLTIESGIPEYFICDVNPKCKYKTDKKSHFERHREKCEKMSQKVITCKQKAYGEDSSVLKQMVRL